MGKDNAGGALSTRQANGENPMGTKGKEQPVGGKTVINARREAKELTTKLTEGIPTLFGRLVYVSQERAILRVSAEVLNEAHKEFFYQWLRLNLKQQKRDLMSYFSGMEDQGVLCDLRAPTMRNILMEACETLIPKDIDNSDFCFFKDRLETILDVRAQWPSLTFR